MFLPPKNKEDRLRFRDGRPALLLLGSILQLFPQDTDSSSSEGLRIIGNASIGMYGETSDWTPLSKFSMAKKNTEGLKLIPTVKPFSQSFNTPVSDEEEILKQLEREKDHDPAGLHKKAAQESEEQFSQAKYDRDALYDQLEDLSQEATGSEHAVDGRDGNDLAEEIQAELNLRAAVEKEKQEIRKLLDMDDDDGQIRK
mmetsp:Transcript_30790/g.99028  ORF Transcript_30790/g.99028 Transcript_30790/m.99028 type:complete len:199 (-) Transcript_30790:136-732(-)